MSMNGNMVVDQFSKKLSGRKDLLNRFNRPWKVYMKGEYEYLVHRRIWKYELRTVDINAVEFK